MIIVGILPGFASIPSSHAECAGAGPQNIPAALAPLAVLRKLDCRPASLPEYESYLADTLSCLDRMRGRDGLIADSAQVIPGSPSEPARLRILQGDTGPTDIALDLLVQAGMAKKGGIAGERARQALNKIVSAVAKLPFHRDPGKRTGLFYRLYRTDRIGVSDQAGALDLSSVDNIHLALALWTVGQEFSGRAGKTARALFERMDFSDFYDVKTGLAYGNIHFDPKTKPRWQPQGWDYGNFGSESRDIYSLGYALGLFREEAHDPRFVSRAVKDIDASMYRSPYGDVLKVYDGGAFQLLLPEVLVGESSYSVRLARSAAAYAPMILADGRKLASGESGARDLRVPGAFSASQSGLQGDPRFKVLPAYIGQSGSPELVINPDYCKPGPRSLWSAVSTVHASVLAASATCADADLLAPELRRMKELSSGSDRLYNAGIGWSDGVYVKTIDGVQRGQVVPAVLSLDQGMLALGILRLEDPHGLGPSADALYRNPRTRARLASFFSAIDGKLGSSQAGPPLQCPRGR